MRARRFRSLSVVFPGEQIPSRLSRIPAILGGQRPAGTLQRAGLITHTRGDVKIIDRKKLEKAACECYGIMHERITQWQADSQ
jgi:hypothetical protein